MARRNLKEVNKGLNFESSTSAHGIWRFPTNTDLCCIYRVPHRIRKINPEAYTPQLVILGPLHHSLKSQASKRRFEDIENTKFMGYLSMEQHKKVYLLALAQRFGGEDIINGFRRVIEDEEEAIRASYSESTTWIQSQDFVEMILYDSVFILEFNLRRFDNNVPNAKTGDMLMDEPSLYSTIYEDLILLENQLPYFILQKLFDPFITTTYLNETLLTLIIKFFGLEGTINYNNSEFKHFTDLFRCVRVDSLNLEEGEVSRPRKYECKKHMHHAEKLHNAGIKFKVIEEELSLDLKFENACLQVPFFRVDDRTEMTLRNIMALEQCHYPYQAYVCNIMVFLDYLIDTDKDVDFLVEKENWIGDHGVVADMLNKLSLGIIDTGSYYYDIALKIDAHYKNPINRSRALLNRVYFKDMWTGTATIAATLLLILTLIQTVSSVIQVLQN